MPIAKSFAARAFRAARGFSLGFGVDISGRAGRHYENVGRI
jgi:hypothetical protein